MAETFFLKVLGTLSLRDGSEVTRPISLQKKRLDLLAILAVGGSDGISRERVQAYLWPESDSTRARHALDQLIYATRRSLGADPVSIAGGEMRLNAGIVRTDLRAFEDALRDGRLSEAVTHYGGPLLDGFYIADNREMESWIDSRRAQLAGEFADALEKLARDAVRENKETLALGWWRKLALHDPLSSRIALEVMRGMAKTGDTPGALKHARTYREFVKAQLGIAADPAIAKLEQEIARSLPVPKSGSKNANRLTSVTPESAAPPVPNSRARFSGWVLVAAAVAMVLLVFAVRTRRPSSPDVGDDRASRKLYLGGVNAWNDRSKSGLDSAIVDFRRAIELSPASAEAYAGLANAYVMVGYSGYRPSDAMFSKAKAAALRSIALDSTSAAAFAALGMELTWERNFADAERNFRRAIALDPRYATAHQWYGILLMITGRKKDAVAELKRAAELDPLSLQIQNNYATFLGIAGDPAAQMQHYRKFVGEEPDSTWVRRNPWLLTNLSGAYSAVGEHDKAIRTAEYAVRILPGHPRAVSSLASAYMRKGDSATAQKIYATMDSSHEHYPAYQALRYLNMGNRDSAFVWFGRVKEWGIPIMISLGAMGDEMRSDSRYVRLMSELGIPVALRIARKPTQPALR